MSIADTIRNAFVPVHREGYPFIAGFAAVAVLLGFFSTSLFWIGAILTAWCAYFYRDPERVTPVDDKLVVSPADGVVSAVGPAVPPRELGLGNAEMTRISVFMNVFSVHVNRAPVRGKIVRIEHRPGKFLNAELDKASQENERNGVVIDSPNGQVAAVQIAGLVARRIVCWADVGGNIAVGERFGLIRFGSRVDVFLPAAAVPRVAVGQTAVAGETILAEFGGASHAPLVRVSLMVAPFKPFEPHGSGGPRIREIPLRMVLPNLITVLAICAGLSGIRLAFQDRFEPAVVMVLLAAFLDGIDGRLARMLKATSRFGAQMDSLADIVNFGVVPALVLYAYLLDKAGSLGWIATLLFAIAMGLRLARFNVLDEDLDRPAWQAEYFVGVPAPIGAITLMLPMYLGFLGLEGTRTVAYVATGFAILVAFLLVSRLPVYSGKKLSIRREYLLPVMLVAVFYVLLLTVYPWQTLTASVIGYLIFLPLSASAYARRARIEGEKAVAATAEAETTDVSDETKPAS